MVSRRNFAAVTIIMAIILFLFQGLNEARENLNHYETNDYAVEPDCLADQSKAFGEEDASGKVNTAGSHGTVVYLGDDLTTAAGAVVADWARYMKYEARSYASLAKYEKAVKDKKTEQPEIMVIHPENIDWAEEKNVTALKGYVEKGIHLVFAGLPDLSDLKKSSGLCELLGIQKIAADQTTVQGLDLYADLMLGGENFYMAQKKEEEKMQDLSLTFPWFKLGGGTKVYMKGIPEDETLQVEDYPVVIWRKSFGTACVFAVNGDYLEDVCGLGILTGVLYETRSYLVYPVVNAQNLIVADFPSLTEENAEQIQTIYGNGVSGVNRDIVWPSIASIYQKNHLGLSCMLSPKLDYSTSGQPDGELLKYYIKLINEEKGETGLSGFCHTGVSEEQKLSEDQKLMEQNLSTYQFSSFYGGTLKEEEITKALQQPVLQQVRTVVQNNDNSSNLIGYLTDHVTYQKTVTDEWQTFTYRTWLQMKSIQSALGYTSVLLDLDRVIYPESEEDTWEKMVKKFSSEIATYWKPFSALEGTTASACDERIRNYLNTGYEETRQDNTVMICPKSAEGTSYYILRTHNEKVKKITGGSAVQLEDSAWLIQAEKEIVSITLESTDQRYYYEKGEKNR